MYRLFLIIGLCLSGFDANAYIQSLSPHNFNALYVLAANENISAINNARARGLNIDSVNQNGDTGLCVAAKRRHRKAFKSFLQSGANPSHPCTWEISGYREFMQSVIENPTKNMDTAVSAQHLTEDKMGWKTKTLIGAGIIAAGAGVGLALGGGGGGGSSYDPNCVHGWYNKDDICVCDKGYTGSKCNSCAEGYGKYNSKGCHKTLACENGSQQGAKCVCNRGYGGTLCESCATGYGRDSTGVCVRKLADKITGEEFNTNYNYNGNIELNNENFADVYGLFYDADKTPHFDYLEDRTKFTNSYLYIQDRNDASINMDTYMDIVVKNDSDGNVYGMYSNNADTIHNNYVKNEFGGAIYGNMVSMIDIENHGNGDVYGIYGNNEVSTISITEGGFSELSDFELFSYIDVKNEGNGNAYGIYNNVSDGKINNLQIVNKNYSAISYVNVSNSKGLGDTYGLYGIGTIENSGFVYSQADAGNAYGIYSKGGKISNVFDNNEANVIAVSAQSNNGATYGAYIKDGSIENGRIIESKTTSGSANAYGIYAEQSKNKTTTVKNTSGINVESFGGDAYGIYNKGGTVTNSTQFYEINVKALNGTAYGIYSNGGKVENSGHIFVAGQNDAKTFGIFATNGAKVTNTGEFLFNINGIEMNPENSDKYCTSSGCQLSSGGYAIYLENGAKFVNDGTISSNNSLILANGTQLAANGKFNAKELSGDLEVTSDVVTKGFEEKYTIIDAIDANETSNLALKSQSAMFNVDLQGKDVVLSKKDFNEIIKNSEVANFLEKNYALKNNEKLFMELKSKSDIKEINSMMKELTGQDVISRFANEESILQHELDFDINNKIFKLSGSGFSFSGSMSNLIENIENNSVYSVAGINTSIGNLGIGLSITESKSDDNDKNVLESKNFQLFMPLYLKNNNGVNTVITSKLAYTSGLYNRDGYNGINYEGKIEKQMMGISTQSRYPIKVLGFDIAPSFETNVTAYQATLSEENKPYNLSIQNDKTYSATLGLGAYIEKQSLYSKKHKLNFMAGAVLYHEFANPYKLNVKMKGMNGSFTLRDENRQDDYIVLRSKFSYDIENVSLYGNFLSYIDNDNRSQIDVGFKYSFN